MKFVLSPIHIIRSHLPLVSALLDRMSADGVSVHIVGGAVRDWLLGIPTADFDIEMMGLSDIDALKQRLKSLGKLNEVGRSFSVLRYQNDGYSVDFSLARQELKTARGHRGFRIDTDSVSDFGVAASRRDFTVNSIGIEWVFGRIVDPFNGRMDISKRVLRHVSDQFDDDPLRVLRAIQFAGRFGFSIHPDTSERCRRLDITELSPARIRAELEKLFRLSIRPSDGLRLLPDLGVMRAWPELGGWERGSGWDAGLNWVDAAAAMAPRPHFWTLICVWVSAWAIAGGASSGVIDRWLARWCDTVKVRQSIVAIVSVCTQVLQSNNPPSDAEMRHFSTRAPLKEVLVVVAAALAEYPQRVGHLRGQVMRLGIMEGPPQPLVTGKSLMALGIPTGPHLGEMLRDFYSAQLDGRLTSVDQAIKIAREIWQSSDDALM